jgi:hypothetical protein
MTVSLNRDYISTAGRNHPRLGSIVKPRFSAFQKGLHSTGTVAAKPVAIRLGRRDRVTIRRHGRNIDVNSYIRLDGSYSKHLPRMSARGACLFQEFPPFGIDSLADEGHYVLNCLPADPCIWKFFS